MRNNRCYSVSVSAAQYSWSVITSALARVTPPTPPSRPPVRSRLQEVRAGWWGVGAAWNVGNGERGWRGGADGEEMGSGVVAWWGWELGGSSALWSQVYGSGRPTSPALSSDPMIRWLVEPSLTLAFWLLNSYPSQRRTSSIHCCARYRDSRIMWNHGELNDL